MISPICLLVSFILISKNLFPISRSWRFSLKSFMVLISLIHFSFAHGINRSLASLFCMWKPSCPIIYWREYWMDLTCFENPVGSRSVSLFLDSQFHSFASHVRLQGSSIVCACGSCVGQFEVRAVCVSSFLRFFFFFLLLGSLSECIRFENWCVNFCKKGCWDFNRN